MADVDNGVDFQIFPWLQAPLQQVLSRQRGHALLLEGEPGDGCWDLALALGQAWLCESAEASARPCGHCAACRLYRQSSHPDQQWLLPQDLALLRGFPVEIKEGRKPSRQIRVDDVRDVIDAMASTSGRGRGRALVIAPAETMNEVAASALLKTLEEPPAGTRIVLASADASRLLPTIRSRCQTVRLDGPDAGSAELWLKEQGVPQPDVLLAAASGRPLEALALHRNGVTADAWAALPRRLQRGEASALAGLGVPAQLDALAKMCHDAMAAATGAAPRYFPSASVVGKGLDLQRLSAWQKNLVRLRRQADHPWNEPLMADALALEARQALHPAT